MWPSWATSRIGGITCLILLVRSVGGSAARQRRDALDLDEHALARRARLHRRARREARALLEESAVHGVELREVLHVAHVAVALEDQLARGAGGLDDGEHVLQRELRLRLEVVGRDSVRLGIERALARDEDDVPERD